MASPCFSVLFVLSHLLLLLLLAEASPSASCEPFLCGNLTMIGEKIGFPFSNHTDPECGPLTVDCDKREITLDWKAEKRYTVSNISQSNTTSITISDPVLHHHLHNKSCEFFDYFNFPPSSFISFTIVPPSITLFICIPNLYLASASYHRCDSFDVYYNLTPQHGGLPPQCSTIQLPANKEALNRPVSKDIFSILVANFSLEVQVSADCNGCHLEGGLCLDGNEGKFQCDNTPETGPNAKRDRDKAGLCSDDNEGKFECNNNPETEPMNKNIARGGNKRRELKLGLGIGIPLILIIGVVIFILRWCYKRKCGLSEALSKNNSSDPYLNSYREGGGVYFGVPVFSYSELEEATNNFHESKELGDGGFGAVYHGILRDGREVAVKRLYEHNYKRVEQFRNEIEILTRLRHRNLVTLYGCTSRHSRELLLVYEYIPNGTVADHLHGDRAKPGSLTWPIRLSIAIETANALAYLHNSEIIHRDVKTNNILLDDNFCVKVADFGLSRLFPTNVTHVSTAPQGTPGYVDPEYYHCYQLTTKSDVYSFGVVLIELLTSLPAVDISRQRHEINLSYLAMTKIESGAYNELIDQSLGFESDITIKKMTISVAELAFQCLQSDKEMRPTMEEVCESLKRIESGSSEEAEMIEEVNDNVGVVTSVSRPPHSPESDEVVLLTKTLPPPSPLSVTANWVSRSTTPNTSG